MNDCGDLHIPSGDLWHTHTAQGLTIMSAAGLRAGKAMMRKRSNNNLPRQVPQNPMVGP